MSAMNMCMTDEARILIVYTGLMTVQIKLKRFPLV